MKELKIFNSLSGRKEVFVPLKENEVSIYVCGPTVYASPHIGNFRPPVVFDTLRRLLLALGYKATYVSNYTDVDDKIIAEAQRLGITEKELTDRVIEEYRQLSSQMGIMTPDFTPTPTAYMGKIIAYIDDLVKKGYAYEVDGDVYFRVKKVKGYGELSGNSVADLEQGARIEVSSKKEDPLDFALWKKTEVGIKWPSPWGEGRPGWHSECCVMIDSLFREQNGLIDIHGGGFDLKFPHHENERAQSLAHNGNGLARYWMHNGFINMGNEKMSKSKHNVMLAKDVVSAYGGLSFRLTLLSTHYRAPVSFSEELLTESKAKLNAIFASYKKAAVRLSLLDIDPYIEQEVDISAFLDGICDDLNTPNALSVLYEDFKKLNILLRNSKAVPADLLKAFGVCHKELSILGLLPEKVVLSREDKESLLAYNEAKANRDYAKSDLLRDELMKKGLL